MFATVFNMGSSPSDVIMDKAHNSKDKKNIVHYTYENDVASASARLLDTYANTVAIKRKSLNSISGNHSIDLFVDPDVYDEKSTGVFTDTFKKYLTQKKVAKSSMFEDGFMDGQRDEKSAITKPSRPESEYFDKWKDEYGVEHNWYENTPYKGHADIKHGRESEYTHETDDEPDNPNEDDK
jgi:antitoxin component YwqK of YwqJK toxin-antitoxin module